MLRSSRSYRRTCVQIQSPGTRAPCLSPSPPLPCPPSPGPYRTGVRLLSVYPIVTGRPSRNSGPCAAKAESATPSVASSLSLSLSYPHTSVAAARTVGKHDLLGVVGRLEVHEAKAARLARGLPASHHRPSVSPVSPSSVATRRTRPYLVVDDARERRPERRERVHDLRWPHARIRTQDARFRSVNTRQLSCVRVASERASAAVEAAADCEAGSTSEYRCLRHARREPTHDEARSRRRVADRARGLRRRRMAARVVVARAVAARVVVACLGVVVIVSRRRAARVVMVAVVAAHRRLLLLLLRR